MCLLWKASISLAIFLNCQSVCFSAYQDEIVNVIEPGDIRPTSPRRYVVVFDIDGTLCCKADNELKLSYAKRNQPDCSIIPRYTVHYVCIPYLEVLLDFLLGKGVRIVFFSAGAKERNIPLVSDLLTSFWGCQKFEALKAEGQFAIFSGEDLHYNKKDLNRVIREGESLQDTMLVEDNSDYTAFGQEPCLKVISLRWWLQVRNTNDNNAVFNSYYMIGVFKTYFEYAQFNRFSLREGILQMNLPEVLKINKHLVRKIVDLGCSEVRMRRGSAKSVLKASCVSNMFSCFFRK